MATACIIDDGSGEGLMSYDAFIYVLLRTASDGNDSFRTAFHADPVGTLAAANHTFNTANLGSHSLTLPSKAEAAALLQEFLPDYDGPGDADMDVEFDFAFPVRTP